MVRFVALLSVAVAALILWVILREERLMAQGKIPLGRLRRFWLKSERRRAPRFRIDWPVRYQRLEIQGNNSARSRDLSLTGVGLVVAERLEVGSQIQVQLTTPNEPPALRLRLKEAPPDGGTFPDRSLKEAAPGAPTLAVIGQVAWIREVPPKLKTVSEARRFFIGVQFHSMDPQTRTKLTKALGEKSAE